MLGAYTTFVVQEVIRAHAPGLFEASSSSPSRWPSWSQGRWGRDRAEHHPLPLWPPAGDASRHHLGPVAHPAAGGAERLRPDEQEVGAPRWMAGALEIDGLSLTYNRVAIVVFACAVFAALMLVLRGPRSGLQVRAVTQIGAWPPPWASRPTGSTP